MNRKEIRGGSSRRGNDTDMRRKEKENRKLQLELRSEKEKLNSAIIKYQKEINEIQAVGSVLPGNNCEQFQQLLLHLLRLRRVCPKLLSVPPPCFCSNFQTKVRCV